MNICYFCKKDIDEPDSGNLSDSNATAQVHEKCLLDYFAWLKRKGRSLKGENWNEKAHELFDQI